jgi:hypothetical protein
MDLDELERLARMATPGPWRECRASRGGCVCGLVWAPDGEHTVAHCGNNEEDGIVRAPATIKATAAYIAAVSPDVVLALVAEIRALRVTAAEREVVVNEIRDAAREWRGAPDAPYAAELREALADGDDVPLADSFMRLDRALWALDSTKGGE